MRPSGKAGLPRWTGWLTQFAKTTGLSIGLGSQWTCQFVSFPFCTCTKHDPARNAKGMKSWNPEWNQERGLPQSLIWTIPMPTVFLILNIANRQHGGPFPADLARRGMLLRTLWDFFSFSIWYFTRGVNTSFQCCDQVLTLSQQLTITFGGWNCSDYPNEASKKGISLPFLNYVSYKLHWLCWI